METTKGVFKRGSGILLHITSLPSAYGIGDFGPQAFRFVDFLTKAGQKYWQILPLNPTDTIYGNSPYSSYSAFAINHLFVSPEQLRRDGLLKRGEDRLAASSHPSRVDYPSVMKFKTQILERAYENFKNMGHGDKDFEIFCRNHDYWLDDFALFLVFKREFKQAVWNSWPQKIRTRDKKAIEEKRDIFRQDLEKIKFHQYLLFKQWANVHKYCRDHKIQVIGDIPIYVNFDSADVWAHPNLFKLDEDKNPIYVAGVPPDYFSETGQRWGNPVYDWEKIEALDYAWWIERLRHNFSLCDFLRIDHFRGLVGYWQVPAEEETAINGEWIPGPGDAFFDKIKEVFGPLPIIAEDLGVITEDVTAAMKKHGFPGMKVLLFTFSGDQETHPYMPKNYVEDCVAYTGTHDNNTVKGWIQHDATVEEKQNLEKFLGKKIKVHSLHWDLIAAILKSKAAIALFPIQDLLGLGDEARMNKPGTAQGNWHWRLQSRQISSALIKKMLALVKETKRIT